MTATNNMVYANKVNGKQVIEQIVEHLSFLVTQDSCNPPRLLSLDDALFIETQQFFQNQGFAVSLTDHDKGRISLFAQRGKPDILFNVHLDTVPITGQWQYPPLQCSVVEDKAYGRGVCDIKGAVACLMALAESTDHDMAVLFTTDEEGTDSCCVSEFIASNDLSSYQQVVVAEPTDCLARLSHRGYVSAQGQFHGENGHSSSVNALKGNAIHQANQWMAQAINLAEKACNESNPAGVCFNLGHIKGGEKNNMIASDCALGFSLRVPPGLKSEQVYKQFTALAKGEHIDWQHSMMAPALPEQAHMLKPALAFCKKHQLAQGDAVNFWTEAALFAQAGIPALVLGPGNIAQAHSIDEWVTLNQLQSCHDIYLGLIR
ncbi:M20/M25/M40 family metallo-hydrolase [Marinicella rhabdoformis]|uniref:M20/M25/M40 family metallo-hydrolase n=1 Tax=Marinicella rhabdoformis TaxID=2580566 RepID=UPI0012AEB3C0|nr:M20/M25/M40 family metallo-hydrolase [Marinicella rhabdoformis]